MSWFETEIGKIIFPCGVVQRMTPFTFCRLFMAFGWLNIVSLLSPDFKLFVDRINFIQIFTSGLGLLVLGCWSLYVYKRLERDYCKSPVLPLKGLKERYSLLYDMDANARAIMICFCVVNLVYIVAVLITWGLWGLAKIETRALLICSVMFIWDLVFYNVKNLSIMCVKSIDVCRRLRKEIKA